MRTQPGERATIQRISTSFIVKRLRLFQNVLDSRNIYPPVDSRTINSG